MKRYNWEYNGEKMGLFERPNGICVLHSEVNEHITELTATAIGLLEELNAVLLLEYHNKNHLQLGTNPKKLNEEKREIVKRITYILKH